MNDAPIHTFLTRMRSPNGIDVGVIFGLMAAREVAGGVVSPAAGARLWPFSDLAPDQLFASIERLVGCGEVVMVEGGGLEVVRFGEFQDLMTDFGRRRYGRMKTREHRKAGKSEVAKETQ